MSVNKFFVLVLMMFFIVNVADARLGGGRSSGHGFSSSRSANSGYSATRSSSSSGWKKAAVVGAVAGAAGYAYGSSSHNSSETAANNSGAGFGFGSILLLLIIMGGIFYLLRRRQPLLRSGNNKTAAFDQQAFVGEAERRFLHLQDINQPAKLSEVKHYVTAEMFQQLEQSIINQKGPSQFQSLQSHFQGGGQSTTGYPMVAVAFQGQEKAYLSNQWLPFREVWYFEKINNDWKLAGIEQKQ